MVPGNSSSRSEGGILLRGGKEENNRSLGGLPAGRDKQPGANSAAVKRDHRNSFVVVVERYEELDWGRAAHHNKLERSGPTEACMASPLA
jgi:hypothetical protein